MANTPQDEGQTLYGGIIQGYVGDYFGATYAGGTNGLGTVFRITSAGTLTILYQFGATVHDGQSPYSGLVQGSDGYLYGTTLLGGSNGNPGPGTIFKIGPTGGLIYVHSFGGVGDVGVNPKAAPVEGYDGNYYGTTFQGGTNSFGTVYKLAYPVSTNNPNEPSSFGLAPTAIPTANNTVTLSLSHHCPGETYQLQFANTLSRHDHLVQCPGLLRQQRHRRPALVHQLNQWNRDPAVFPLRHHAVAADGSFQKRKPSPVASREAS